MPTEFTLPELGENIAAGDVLRILVKPGDTIAKDQPVLELETDKATIEVPSSVAGTVKDVKVKAGEKVKVGQAILSVEESASPAPKAAEAKQAPAKPAPAGVETPPAPARQEPAKAEPPPPQENKVVDINRGGRAAVAEAAAAPETPPAPAAPSVRR